MVNRQANIRPHIPLDFHQQAIAARRSRLLINYGVLLISAAGSMFVHTAARANGGPSGYAGCPIHPLVAFLLFLLGMWMVILAPVADQFPGAARIGEAIARAVHHYLFGGGN